MKNERLIKAAFNRGFEYEKNYRGCAQCTVAAIQDTLGIRNDFVFKAAGGFAAGGGMLCDGICGGYTGTGIKTIVPYRARVKIDVRIVPDMHPDDIVHRLKAHLERVGYGDVAVVLYEGTDWSKTDPDSDLAQAECVTNWSPSI